MISNFSERMSEIYREYCMPHAVRGLPLQIMTTRIDRFDLGRKCASGPDEANMAMWSETFSGGVQLAHYILDHPDIFRGKNVIDVGSGSGVVALVAATVGAHVTAVDSSAAACDAIAINAKLNNLKVGIICTQACSLDYCAPAILQRADIITAADVFYSSAALPELATWFGELASAGKTIFATSQDEDLSLLLETDGASLETIVSRRNWHSFVRLERDDGRKAMEKCHGSFDSFPYNTPSYPHRGKRPSYAEKLKRHFAAAWLSSRPTN